MYKFGQTSSTGFRSSLHVSRIFSNSLIAGSPCLFFWAAILLNWPRSDYYALEDVFLLFSRGFSTHNGFGTQWSTQTGALYDSVRSPDSTEHLRASLMLTSSRGRLVAHKVNNIKSSDVFILLDIFFYAKNVNMNPNSWYQTANANRLRYDITIIK